MKPHSRRDLRRIIKALRLELETAQTALNQAEADLRHQRAVTRLVRDEYAAHREGGHHG